VIKGRGAYEYPKSPGRFFSIEGAISAWGPEDLFAISGWDVILTPVPMPTLKVLPDVESNPEKASSLPEGLAFCP